MEPIEFEIVWESIDIKVRFRRYHPIHGMHHVELMCDERIPVTETGYRSHFTPDETLHDQASVKAAVLEWLGIAAKGRVWLDYVEASKQGDLFDL